MTLSLAYESSIEKCLQSFLKEESLGSQDKYRCDKCKQLSKAKVRNELSKLPSVLIFHIKRFEFPSMKKLKGKVKYSSVLDMQRFN